MLPELKAPVFEKIQVPEYKPIQIPDFKPVVVSSHDDSQMQAPKKDVYKYKPCPIEQNKYFNAKLHENLATMQEEQHLTAEELEYLNGTDREIFYKLLVDWDYGGIKAYD